MELDEHAKAAWPLPNLDANDRSSKMWDWIQRAGCGMYVIDTDTTS